MKPSSPYSINFTRLAFLIISIVGGIAIAASTRGTEYPIPIWVGTLGGVISSCTVIYLEQLSRRFTLRGFSTATFGLMIGIFCAWLLNFMPLQELINILAGSQAQANTLHLIYQCLTYLILAFIGITISLRSGQEDFAFIIPYIRFRQTNASEQRLVLAASATLDGRLIPLLESGVIEGHLIIPRYILDEITAMAESPDQNKKHRGERALEMLEKLRKDANFKITVSNGSERNDENNLDALLTQTTKLENAKLITSDDALTKAARLQGINVLNLDEIAEAFHPPINVGEKIKLAITRPGKDENQGVGYLSDGSMIVVNNAAKLLGTTQSVVVISKLQTNTGLMVFAELEDKT